MRVVHTALLVCLLSATLSLTSAAQFSLPGFGTKSAAGNDAKAAQLLHDKLPLVLDANSAYPTVPDRDMLGGPFRGELLHITLDTLTKPLAPGDYVLPMTFFCSEYSIHRPGAGTAYVLAPARGTAARAISTLLWRGMLAGYKPQDLQSVSWAIQGSVPYSNMPQAYRTTIDQLIPDMKNQVNGQAFADIEDGFQGKVNRFTRKVNQGMTKATGGYVKFDLKLDLELNDSFTRLGRLGRSALDGEHIADIVQDLTLTDAQRQTALYAGQGSQAPPLPAANGPWSVIVPGVAYMRFTVRGGNLQGDNVMQIRILKPGAGRALMTPRSGGRPHIVLAQYSQSTPEPPSLLRAFNGSINQANYQQCHASDPNNRMCLIQSVDVTGAMEYPVGSSQISVSAPTQSVETRPGPKSVCVKKVLYEPTAFSNDNFGLCIYLAVVEDDGSSCKEAQTVKVDAGKTLNWVQTYKTNFEGDPPDHVRDDRCRTGTPHKDVCSKVPVEGEEDGPWLDAKRYGPMYRSDLEVEEGRKKKKDPKDEPWNGASFYTAKNPDFRLWESGLQDLGKLQSLFRDIPHRGKPSGICKPGGLYSIQGANCAWVWHTAADPEDTLYLEPSKPTGTVFSSAVENNDLRLVSYDSSSESAHFNYTPLIRVKYGIQVDWQKQIVKVNDLVIGRITMGDSNMPSRSDTGAGDEDSDLVVDGGGSISFAHLRTIDFPQDASSLGTTRAQVCRPLPHSPQQSVPFDGTQLGPPPTQAQRGIFPYDNKIIWDEHGPRRRGDN